MPFMNFMNITRALSDENRVRILMALRHHAFCVCQITAFLDLSPSTTSKHLSVLKSARLIEAKKEGKWVYYRLADSPDCSPAAREAIAWAERSIGDTQTIRRDDERIEKMVEAEKEKFGAGECRYSDAFHSAAVHSLEQVD